MTKFLAQPLERSDAPANKGPCLSDCLDRFAKYLGSHPGEAKHFILAVQIPGKAPGKTDILVALAGNSQDIVDMTVAVMDRTRDTLESVQRGERDGKKEH